MTNSQDLLDDLCPSSRKDADFERATWPEWRRPAFGFFGTDVFRRLGG